MFKLFKKKAPATPVVQTTKTEPWQALLEHFKQMSAESIREPLTLAQMRLNGGAKDRGAIAGMRMYNAHKAKLQNQWINPLQSVNSGFGNAQFSFYNYQTVNYWQCLTLAQDPLFTKVFNMLSNSPFSKGGQLTQPEGADLDEDAIEKAATKYHLWEEIRAAVRSSYVTGGCLIYMDFGQGEQERMEPLNLRKVNMHKFKGFKHIDPINITAVNVNTVDPVADDYMKPNIWYVIGLGTVHRSHFLHFETNAPELPMRPLTMYFGMPLTQLIKQDIANSNLVSQGVANLINRSRLVYLTADDTALTTDNAAQFRARLEWMSMVQDNFGVAPLKQGETVQQLTTALTGFAENVEQCYLLISAKTDIPFTELMGKSASGMNATGEGDRRKWYDKCRTIQESVKREILTMYGIVAGKVGDGKFIEFPDYVFNPLEEATEKELAENIKAYTEVANGLVGLGADPKGVVEWLKSFKQFNLEEIDFDTSAPGLEDYDDTDPDGTPGGGLPREDITPKVLEAVKAMNGNFNEPDHPRHADGKFAPKAQGESGSLNVKGNELAGFAITGEALRDVARTYYEENLAGHSVKHPELGDVFFSKSGHKKPISFSADERKLRMFPFLPDIIKNGQVMPDDKDRYGRKNVTAFYTLKSPVVYDGKTEIVRVTIRKDNMGRLYYDHVINKTLEETPAGNKSGGSKGVNNSIAPEEWIVNLFIED